MSRKTKIIRRDSDAEQTIAVISWKGSAESMLIHDLRAALTEWFETEDGQAVLGEVEGDFNIGDLANCGLEEASLAECLANHNIYELDVEVFSNDYVDHQRDYDTRLGPDARSGTVCHTTQLGREA